MARFACSHLSDPELLRTLTSALADERAGLVRSLDCLAEVARRRLYAPLGYSSLGEFCVAELHLSESAAYKRLRALRAIRRFPLVHAALADGRLHLSAIVELEPRLSEANVAEWVAAATHQSRRAVQRLLAARFPRPDVPTVFRTLAVAAPAPRLSPATVAPAPGETSAPAPTGQPAALPALPALPRTRFVPLSDASTLLCVTLDAETLELLDRAKALLSHAMPGADATHVLKRVLQDWVRAADARKYGLTDKPRVRKDAEAKDRRIPNAIKREVVQRDKGRCTFVDDAGRRCGSREFLEFDHITPIARGGQGTVANLRLRCRTHNQLEAERAFGAGFMQQKRPAQRAEGHASRGRGAREGRAAERFRSQDGEGSAQRGGSAAGGR